MQVLYKDETSEILRLNRNEKVIETLSSYINSRSIPSATFSLIGAISSALLSFYNLTKKEYETRTFDEELEIASVIGNIVFIDSHIKIHAHGTFSKDDFTVIGGHIQELTISATGEVHIHKLTKKLTRTFDKETGLYLLED